MTTAPESHRVHLVDDAVERPHPGRTAGVVLGAAAMLLLLAVGVGALIATAVDLIGWSMQG